MQHKGELIEKAVRESGFSITKLADKIGKSRRWVYQIFDKPNVSVDVILEIGRIIHHDFTSEIKELKAYKQSVTIQRWEDPEGEFFTEAEKSEYWKNKYLLLLEKYNELLLSK
jgi:predicted transcriptional regulator